MLEPMNLDRTCARLAEEMVAAPDPTPFLTSAARVLADELDAEHLVIFQRERLTVLGSTGPVPALRRLEDGTLLADGSPVAAAEAPDGHLGVAASSARDLRALEQAAWAVSKLAAHVSDVASLRASAERLKLAQELANLGSYDWEIATDTNRWSDQLFRIYGHEPGTFNASYERFMSLIHPEDRERIREIHQHAYETGEPFEMEERIIRPDGSIRTLKSNGLVIMGDDGKPARMTGICWDITDLKAAEETRRQLHEAETARQRSLEINDEIVQRLSLASNALEHGSLREGIRYVHETLMEARRIAGEMLEQASDRGSQLEVLTRSEAAVPSAMPASEPHVDTGDLVRVIVADDTPGMRVLVREFLNPDAGFTVVGEAATGYEVLALAQDLKPDLIVLDLSMPEMDGMQAIPELQRLVPQAAILVMSGYGGPMIDRALAAGASSYVEKGTGFNQLVARAREVVRLAS